MTLFSIAVRCDRSELRRRAVGSRSSRPARCRRSWADDVSDWLKYISHHLGDSTAPTPVARAALWARTNWASFVIRHGIANDCAIRR